MHAIARELDEALDRLAPARAAELEQLVREAVKLIDRDSPPAEARELDHNGYPVGYFDRVFGSLASERFDYPDDPPPDLCEPW